jgi:exopolysaccharide biosynthesis predicted pyruvyltransferase EpsI
VQTSAVRQSDQFDHIQSTRRPLANPATHMRAELLRRIGPELTGDSFALLDYPAHANAGDSAIWLGELALLQALKGVAPTYVSAWNNCSFDALDRFDGQILLQGGGNFGDLWPRYHGFRLDVLRRYRSRRIVHLPQTIHFEDPAKLEETRRAIGEHGNVMLFVRDVRSLDIARLFDCDVALAPDSAFMLDLKPSGEPLHEFLYLHRTDKEQAPAEPGGPLPAGWHEADWSRQRLRWGAYRARALALQVLKGDPHRDRYREALYRAVAAERVRRAVDLLSSGRLVVTDRLHGHILCTVLGIPHDILDNSYGKLSGFVSTWGTASPGAPGRLVDDLSEVPRRSGIG